MSPSTAKPFQYEEPAGADNHRLTGTLKSNNPGTVEALSLELLQPVEGGEVTIDINGRRKFQMVTPGGHGRFRTRLCLYQFGWDLHTAR